MEIRGPSSRLGRLSIAAAFSVGLFVALHGVNTVFELPEAALRATAAAFARVEHGIVGGGADHEGEQIQARHLFGGLFGGRSNGGSRTKRLSGGGSRYGDNFRKPSGSRYGDGFRSSPASGPSPYGWGGSRYGSGPSSPYRSPSKPSYNSPPTYKSPPSYSPPAYKPPPSYGDGGYCQRCDEYIDNPEECGGDYRTPEYQDFEDVENIIHAAIDMSSKYGCFGNGHNFATSLVRLAFHDSAGNMDAFVDLKDPENRGLKCVINVLYDLFEKERLSGGEPIKCVLSKADFYAFSAIAAVKYAAKSHGYIPRIKVRWGRCTYKPTSSSDRGPQEYFPEMSAMSTGEQVLDYFYEYYDFSSTEAVALLGAHTLGGAEKKNSGYENTWTPNPTKFDAEFYSVMREIEWEVVEVSGKFQWKSCTRGGSWGDTRGQCFGLMLHVDMGLYRDIDDYVCTEKGSKARYMNSDKKCKYGEIIGYPPGSKCGTFDIGGTQPILASCFHHRDRTSEVVVLYSEDQELWIDEFAEVFDRMMSKRVCGKLQELRY